VKLSMRKRVKIIGYSNRAARKPPPRSLTPRNTCYAFLEISSTRKKAQGAAVIEDDRHRHGDGAPPDGAVGNPIFQPEKAALRKIQKWPSSVTRKP